MTNKEPTWWQFLLIYAVALWIVGCLMTVMVGLAQSSELDSGCNYKYNADKIFPTRQLGCWLGERIDK